MVEEGHGLVRLGTFGPGSASKGEIVLTGLMTDAPLMISAVLEYGAKVHASARVVSRTVEGPIHSYTYAEASG